MLPLSDPDETDEHSFDPQACNGSNRVQLRVLPNVSMEATAKFVAEHVGNMLDETTGGRVFIQALECRENDKNSGWYYPQGTDETIPQATSTI